MARANKAFFPVITIFIGIMLALLLAEGIVRVFFDQPVNPRFVMNSGFGVRANQPNVRTRHYVPGEYDVKISTNSAGLRGQKDYIRGKPSDVYRIALIGDSYVYGFGVNDKEVVSVKLEERLNELSGRAGARFEVLNFGISGFGQAEELLIYRNLAREYNPDEVILFYFNNDPGNNMVSKLFKLDEDGKLVRTDNDYLPGVKAREILYAIAPIRWLFTHSQAWNLVRNRLSALVQKALLKEQGLKRADEPTIEGVALTRSLMKKFIEEIRIDGALPSVFLIPNRSIETNFPMSSDEVKAVHAGFIDGREFLVTDDYYKRDSHWRPIGHVKAASVLGDLVYNHFLVTSDTGR